MVTINKTSQLIMVRILIFDNHINFAQQGDGQTFREVNRKNIKANNKSSVFHFETGLKINKWFKYWRISIIFHSIF